MDYHFCGSVEIACILFPREFWYCMCLWVCVHCERSVCFNFRHILNCFKENNAYGAYIPPLYCLTVTPGELLALKHNWLNSAHMSIV